MKDKLVNPLYIIGFGICIIVLITSFLFMYTNSKIGYDTGLYHLQKVRWLVEYGHVPGLANLDGRMGFFSLYFYFGALLTHLFDNPESVFYINLSLVLFFIVWICYEIYKSNQLFECIALLIILSGLLLYQNLFKSMYQDVGVYIVSMILLFSMLKRVYRKQQQQLNFIILGVIFLISLKLSMIFLAILPVLFFFRNPISIYKEHQWALILSFLLLGLLFYHNYMMSGWILYPSSLIDIFSPEWKVPRYLVDNQNYVTYSFALKAGSLTDLISYKELSFLERLEVWWFAHTSIHTLIYIVGVSLFAIVGFYFVKPRKYSTELISIILSVSIGLIGWYLKAPSPRFGYVWFISILVLTVYILFSDIEIKKPFQQYLKMGGMLIVVFLFLKQSYLISSFRHNYPPFRIDLSVKLPQIDMKAVQAISSSDELLFIPIQGERTYYSDKFPMTSRLFQDSLLPFINDIPRYRGKTFEKGFYTDTLSSKRINKF